MSATRTTPFAIVLVTLGALTVAYSLFASGDSDTRGYLVVAAIVIATAAVVFGPVASRAEADPARARKTAWWLAGLSVITLPVFWLGIPAILGGAAVQVGRQARVVPAAVLGALATVTALVGMLFG